MRSRLPITITVLRQLKTQLHHSRGLCILVKRMLLAAFCLSFYGFLRASEFTSHHTRTFDKHTTLCRHDVQFTQASVKVNIKASKTDPFHRGYVLHIAATTTSTCPASALTKYFATFYLAQKRPLFTFADGSCLTRQSLTEHLRTLLTSVGHDATAFASHSFRIGAATTAATAGLPDWLIQALGRWSSSCYTTHTHSAAHHRFSIQAAHSTPVLPYWHTPVIAIASL